MSETCRILRNFFLRLNDWNVGNQMLKKAEGDTSIVCCWVIDCVNLQHKQEDRLTSYFQPEAVRPDYTIVPSNSELEDGQFDKRSNPSPSYKCSSVVLHVKHKNKNQIQSQPITEPVFLLQKLFYCIQDYTFAKRVDHILSRPQHLKSTNKTKEIKVLNNLPC